LHFRRLIFLTSYDLISKIDKNNKNKDVISIERSNDVHSFVTTKLASSENNENVYNDTIKEIEKSLIKEALSKTKWNRSKAARMLGINRITLRRKIEEFNISFPNN